MVAELLKVGHVSGRKVGWEGLELRRQLLQPSHLAPGLNIFSEAGVGVRN